MDLEENIRIAAEVYVNSVLSNGMLHGASNHARQAFIQGAKSQAAKDYWYNEFKAEQLPNIIGDGILEQSNNVPIHKIPEQCPDIKYLIDGSWDKYKEFIYYNPDRPISFGNWKYMVEHYPNQSYHATKEQFEPGKPFKWIDCNELNAEMNKVQGKRIGIIGHVDHGKTMMVTLGARNKGKSLMASIEQIPFEMGGLGQAHHKGVIAIVPDQSSMDYASEITRMIAEDKSVQKIMVVTRAHYEAQGKDSLLRPINSIVPIADVIPDKIAILNAYDSADKATMLRDKHAMDKPWDVKKQKKENHKRNNKRK